MFLLTTLIAVGCSINSDTTKTNEQNDGHTQAPARINTYKKHDDGSYYGAFVVTGYATIERRPEAYCDENCFVYDYIFFNIIDINNNLVSESLDTASGSPFIKKSAIGIGCEQDGIISYYSSSNEFETGTQKIELNEETSQAILESTKNNPVTLEIENLPPTGGMGASTCTSLFNHFRLLK